MRTFRLSVWAFLPIILLLHSAGSPAQSVCAAPEVKLGKNFILVTPTGTDDTGNIQCAFDLAVERKIPEIRLARGEFFIGSLAVSGFRGTLQGGGRDETQVTLLPRSIDCEATGAAITFAGGEPRIRWLSLVWPQGLQGLACIQEDRFLTTLIRVTGSGLDASSCGHAVIHATFDRVMLRGPLSADGDYTASSAGIRVTASASAVADCDNTLLGSFRLNRSAIGQFGTGVAVAMAGDAQLGIFGNSFEGNNQGIVLANSDVIATVSGNRFLIVPLRTFSTCQGSGVGILSFTGMAGAPVVTRLSVLENTFEVPEPSPCPGFGVRLVEDSRTSVTKAVISENRFVLASADGGATGIHSEGVSGAVVKGNTFHYIYGSELGVATNGLFHSGRLSADWTIVTNTFEGEALYNTDILLGEFTSNALVGAGQGAWVVDYGTDNIVLPQQ